MSADDPTFDEILRADLEKEELRDALRAMSGKLAKARNKQDALCAAAFEGAQSAMLALGAPKPVKLPVLGKAKGRPEVALWHLSDWQGSKLTVSYNTNVMRERVRRYVEKALKITKIHRSDHDVDDCVVAFGGDMIEGLFNFPTQPYEIDSTLFDQYVNVADLIVETLRAALAIYKTVHVVPEWGNHGRIGSKRDAVPKSDNADRMTYQLARALLKDETRITWQDCPEDIQRLEIGNYRALVIHGDEVGRNGFASPTTMVNHANKWRSGAYAWDFRDIYMGHYHNHAEWSMANGKGTIYQTGSTESDNRYARDTMAASAIPSQRLHFIDPVKGRVTAQYKIILQEDDER